VCNRIDELVEQVTPIIDRHLNPPNPLAEIQKALIEINVLSRILLELGQLKDAASVLDAVSKPGAEA